jgi:hypothetical protein
MGQAVREPAVVGEQQEALRGGVEPPDRVDPGIGRHQVDHDRPALGIRRRGHHPGGLVEQVVDQALAHPEHRAVDLDRVVLGIGPGAERGDLRR